MQSDEMPCNVILCNIMSANMIQSNVQYVVQGTIMQCNERNVMACLYAVQCHGMYCVCVHEEYMGNSAVLVHIFSSILTVVLGLFLLSLSLPPLPCLY